VHGLAKLLIMDRNAAKYAHNTKFLYLIIYLINIYCV
jgi:hypothetical protein